MGESPWGWGGQLLTTTMTFGVRGGFLPGDLVQCATFSLSKTQPFATRWVVGSALSHQLSTGGQKTSWCPLAGPELRGTGWWPPPLRGLHVCQSSPPQRHLGWGCGCSCCLSVFEIRSHRISLAGLQVRDPPASASLRVCITTLSLWP